MVHIRVCITLLVLFVSSLEMLSDNRDLKEHSGKTTGRPETTGGYGTSRAFIAKDCSRSLLHTVQLLLADVLVLSFFLFCRSRSKTTSYSFLLPV